MDETPHYQIMPEHCLGGYGDSKLINLACDEFFRRRGEKVGLSFRERAYEYGKRAAKRRAQKMADGDNGRDDGTTV